MLARPSRYHSIAGLSALARSMSRKLPSACSRTTRRSSSILVNRQSPLPGSMLKWSLQNPHITSQQLAPAVDRAQQGHAPQDRRQRLRGFLVGFAQRLPPRLRKARDGPVTETVVDVLRRELFLEEGVVPIAVTRA